MHLFDDLLHGFDRAGRSSHNAGTHMREICFVKVLVTEHGDKHGRDAVEAGDLLLIDAAETFARRKCGNRGHRNSVCDGRGHCQYHAEAMEHRNLNHHAILGRKIHTVADCLAVVDDIIMRQHDAFREAGCAGCVLHICNIILFDCTAAALYFGQRHCGMLCNRFIPC